MRSARAFTLGETMITVAIVGAFLVLVLMRYTHPLAVGQANSAGLELSQIAAALDSYSTDAGAYPGTCCSTYVTVNPSLFGGANNEYFNSYPSDTGNVYTYVLGYGSNNTSTFLVYDQRVYDGASLPNLKCTDGTTPIPGRAYRIGYDTLYGGMFALGPY